MDINNAFVTGGAGFIGSHIVDQLVGRGAEVTIYDNFSTGHREFIAHHSGNSAVRVLDADVLDLATLTQAMRGHDFVFHMQANADVRGGMTRTRVDLEQNTICTWNVLEAMRITETPRIAFASSATIYGEPDVFPTPENIAPLQTSLYGASKYASEAMIQAYCEYFGIKSFIFRFVSWIGERYTHGVIFDFMKKLRDNPRRLTVLGDGRQRKSYLDVVDGVSGIFFGIEHGTEHKNIFNLGHNDFMNVMDLARIMCDELGLGNVEFETTGGERGWLGDSPFVHLDTSRLGALGWRPTVSIEDGIRNTVRYLREWSMLLSSP